MINLHFFLLPFFLFFSVITNAVGYYLFLFLFPILIVIKYKIEIPSYVKQIGIILFAMYICFTISNFLNLIFPNRILPDSSEYEHVSFFKMLNSRLPTSYLTTSIFLFVLFYISKINLNIKTEKRTSKNFHKKGIKPLESFIKGAFYASVFFGIVFFLEYFFKIHYGPIIHHFRFRPDPALLNQVNRPTGLLGNPLTLASMSLAFFTFFYVYFCRCFFLEKNNDHIPFIKNKSLLILYVLVPSLIFLFILFLTLARTAISIAFLVLILSPLFSINKKNFLNVFLFVSVLMVFSYFICDSLGYVQRIVDGIQNLNQSGHMDNRKFFRQIYARMFLDKIWIGNGAYWIHEGIRDKYFVLLGYANLNERNFPAHNLYLEILASGGLFCATVVGYGVLKLGTIIKKNLMNRQLGNYTIWVAFVTAFVVNLGHAFTQNNFLESSTTYMYFYFLFIVFWEKYLGSS